MIVLIYRFDEGLKEDTDEEIGAGEVLMLMVILLIIAGFVILYLDPGKVEVLF